MKRNLMALACTALTAVAAWAVPARPLATTLIQPDGSEITVTSVGDEWCHGHVTSDGLAVSITPEGHAVYITTEGATGVYAHEPSMRTPDEQALIAQKGAQITFNAIREASPLVQTVRSAAVEFMRSQAKAPRVAADDEGMVSLESGDSQVPHSGRPNVPIILVNYTDIKFLDADPKATYEKFFNGTEGYTARKYFNDMSGGAYDPNFVIIGPINLSHNREYYGGNSRGNDQRPGEMVQEALQKSDPDIDYSIFDNDGDGTVDVTIVLYAGVGEADSYPQETKAIWPHQWDLVAAGVGKYTTGEGVKCHKYAVFNEVHGINQDQIAGVGTFCHEFSHCLGLPDFYDTVYGGHFGMGDWSVLDHACYNSDGYIPLSYTAYEKAYLGWLKIPVGKENTKYTLQPLNNPDRHVTDAMMLINSADANEYFIFENRKKHGWDIDMPDEGMLITHVTYSAGAWDGNFVNNYDLQRMTVVPADGKLNSASQSGDLWPKRNATEFTPDSSPACTTNTGGDLGRSVTLITRDASTGNVTFWLDRQHVEPIATPEPQEPTPGDVDGSFTATWSVDNVDLDEMTFTLEAWPKTESLGDPLAWADFRLGAGSLTNAQGKWTTSGYTRNYSDYLQIGSTSIEGAIYSPLAVEPDNGYITIATLAKRNGTTDEDCYCVLSVLDADDNEVASAQFPVDDAYIYVVESFRVEPGKYKVRIGNKGAERKRIRLKYAMAFGGYHADAEEELFEKAITEVSGYAATSAPKRAATSVSASGKVTVTGITGSSYTLTDLDPMATYKYRVKAVPNDEGKADESEWSEIKEIDLSKYSGINGINVAPAATFTLFNGELTAPAGSRLFNASGAEVAPASSGRFLPSTGVYILVAPGCAPVKVVI